MGKKFVHEYQFKNFTDEIYRHYSEMGCLIEFKEETVEIWYIPELEKAA